MIEEYAGGISALQSLGAGQGLAQSAVPTVPSSLAPVHPLDYESEQKKWESVKLKEKELIRQLLELHGALSLQNDSLNLFEMLNQTDKIQSLCEKEDSRRRFLESEPKAEAAPAENAAEGEGEHGGGAHGGEHAEHEHDTTKLDVVLFMLLCMFVGQLFKQFAGWSGIPYTSLITILGLVLGVYYESLGRLGVALKIWSQIDPHLLLLLFLPALIFESAFNSDWHIFKVEMAQVLLMAGPMLLVSTGLSALMMRYILGYDGEFTFEAALLYGSIISATDPVAVVVLLKELGASRRLATLIEGESLLNDGTAMVVFLVILDIVKGKELTVGDIIVKFGRLSLGGPLLGVLGGMIVTFMLRRIHNNFVLEVNTTIFSSYLIFFLAEATPVHVSGILALVALGLYMTRSGKTRISAESEHSVHHVWGYIGFIAETVIFILTGLIMGQRAVQDSNIGGWDVFKLVVGTYPILHVIRFGIILMFWPILAKLGYGLTFPQVLVCAYAGLRGAVGMSLALMVTVDDQIPAYIQDIILLHVAGIALMTLLINATTTGALVRYLGLSKQSDLQKNILFGLAYKLDQEVDKNIENLKDKRHFNHVDWDSLKQSVAMTGVKERLKNFRHLHLDGEQAMMEYAINNLEYLQKMDQKIKLAEEISNKDSLQPQKVPAALAHLTNIHKFENANETFRGLKKARRHEHLAPVYKAINVPDDGSLAGEANAHDQERNQIPIYQQGRTNVQELMSELRHKYLTILKSNYWEFFEEGQCMPDSVIVLIESADRCMDDESKPMTDWEFIQSYLISDATLKFLGGISQVPWIGRLFRHYLFDHFSLSYDIIVNFIEAHEAADKMLQAVIESKDFVGKILTESQKQVMESESYMGTHIEDMFPEISKAIQHRRAQYYLLVHEYHAVDKMLKHGQIEDKDANELKQEIDRKIYYLTMHQPEIQLVGQNHRIIYYSELSEIFDREQLQQAVENMKEFKEQIYEPKKQILQKGQSFGEILYVARGTIVEKNGEYLDPHVGSLKFKKGRIACLQNLLPSKEEERHISDLYCHHSSIASVAPLDLKFLKHVLEKDEDKLLKLWQILAPRMIILSPDKLPQFLPLTQEKIKLFCKMCRLQIYRPGDPVEMKTGGVIFRGGLSKTNADIKIFHQQLDDAEKLELADEFDLKQDQDDFRTPTKGASRSLQTMHHAKRSSASHQASKKFIQKKKALHNLGNMMKIIGKQNLEDSEIVAVQFIAPDERQKGLVARSKDYVVIMHFGESFRGKIHGGNIDEQLVEEAFREYDLNMKNEAMRIHLNFPGELAKLEYGRTFQKQPNGSAAKELVAINKHGAEYRNLPPEAKEHLQRSLKKNIMTANTQSLVPARKGGFPTQLALDLSAQRQQEADPNDVSLVLGDNDLDNSRLALRAGTTKTVKEQKAGHSANLRVPGMAFNDRETTISHNGVTGNGARTGAGGGLVKAEQFEYDDTDEEMGQVHDEGDVKVKHVDV